MAMGERPGSHLARGCDAATGFAGKGDRYSPGWNFGHRGSPGSALWNMYGLFCPDARMRGGPFTTARHHTESAGFVFFHPAGDLPIAVCV